LSLLNILLSYYVGLLVDYEGFYLLIYEEKYDLFDFFGIFGLQSESESLFS